MKSKHWIIAILAVLIILTAQPLICVAAAPSAEFIDTDVSCIVESSFEFTLPPNATIRYPDTSVLVGQFVVGDLLLRYDEQLSVELTPGVMAARADAADVLPYTVSFSPPTVIDEARIGQGYSVVVTIDAGAFNDAARTVYDADLLFQVRSSVTDEVIWQGITTVTARKAQTGGGGDAGDGDNGDDGNAAVPDTGDNTIPDEQVPQASPGTESDNGLPGENIPGEDIPEAQPDSVFWWWWIPIVVLGALLFALLLWLLLWHNVTVSVYGLDLLGQEELIRTIRRLRRKRDEVIISLESKHVRGGVSSVVELGKAFTKRMKGRVLTVKVDDVRVFSAIIPADADGKYRTGFISWME